MTHYMAFVLACGLAVSGVPALADIRTNVVTFTAGTNGSTIKDTLVGDGLVDHVVRAAEGQTMRVELSSTSPSVQVDILAPDREAALFTGLTSGRRFEGVLPASGAYRLRVSLMDNAAHQEASVGYTLSVQIAAGFADGDAGGPDWWRVTGLSRGGKLNIRSAAGTTKEILGFAREGAALRNFGCRGEGTARWCQVEGQDGLRGWVSGRFLQEGPAPASASAAELGDSSETARAEDACRQALAGSAGVGEGDITVLETLWGEAGYGVTMTRVGVDGRWSCLSDGSGNVQGLAPITP